MKWLSRFTGRFAVMTGLFRFLWQQKLWWMIPLIVVLMLVGTLLILAASTPLGPFIYTLI